MRDYELGNASASAIFRISRDHHPVTDALQSREEECTHSQFECAKLKEF